MLALAALGFLMIPSGPEAHGVIENPPSRNWICGYDTRPEHFISGTVKYPACSTAFAFSPDPRAMYNYMSVVTHGLGRAQVTPLPKNVCGFDGETWKGAATPWDAPMAWPAQHMTPGPHIFTWNIQWGPHIDDTEEFRYWITKADFVFSPTKALTWDDFETEAFCVEKFNGVAQAANPDITVDKANNRMTTRCSVPERKGHHVIYSEWGRTPPTLERFHGCVDVAFGEMAAINAPAGLTSGAANRGAPAGIRKATDALGRARSPGAAKMHLAVPAR